MNKEVLETEVQEYIFDQSETTIDLTKLILSGSPFPNISVQAIAQQIQGRLKAKQKLTVWYQTKGIYYPPTLNLEQTSSEITARYKSNLISGEHLVDLTGGFGIDDYFFSNHFSKVTHCELNEELSLIVKHNLTVLKIDNIVPITGNGLDILKHQKNVDWIYIDPSRRHESKGKVFFLEDCLPNVPEQLNYLYQHSQQILIKTSPLLDISAGLQSLNGVKEIHCVAVNNEVKELLWVLDKNFLGSPIIKTINLNSKSHSQEFSFNLVDEHTDSTTYNLPNAYLYEPNAAIMKSGGFNTLTTHFNVDKLHPNSHLYTSSQIIDNFPGRSFIIENSIPYQKSALKKLGIIKANITTRNFPETVIQLRKKFKIKDGGDIYIFFTTNCESQKTILICKKIN